MKKMNSLKGIFDNRPPCKKNFIQENVRQLRSMQKSLNNKDRNAGLPQKLNKSQHATVSAKVPAYISTTSKHRAVPSSQTIGRAKTSYATTRPSIHSTSLQARGDSRQRSKSAQLPVSRSVPSQTSQIHSTNKYPDTLERDYSDIASKVGSKLSSQIDVDSITKPVSSISFSRSAKGESLQYLPMDKSDTWCSLSENLITVQPIRNVGCQTVSPEDREGIFNEGVIKYPSACNIKVIRSESIIKNALMNDSSQQTDSFLLEEGVYGLGSKNTSTRQTNRIIPADVQLQNVHNIPQPLTERLLQQLKGVSSGGQKINTKNRKNVSPRKGRNKDKARNESVKKCLDFDKQPAEPKETSDPACPLGHVPVPEPERVETLRMLRKSYEEHIRELNCLPVKTDTLKMRQRKMELEKQLNKLEEGIKIFSRPKVFVKIGV